MRARGLPRTGKRCTSRSVKLPQIISRRKYRTKPVKSAIRLTPLWAVKEARVSWAKYIQRAAPAAVRAGYKTLWRRLTALPILRQTDQELSRAMTVQPIVVLQAAPRMPNLDQQGRK